MENTQPEQTTVKEQVVKTAPKVASNKKLAIVLVRGLVGLNQRVRDTLQMLRLHRKNNCVIVSDDPIMRGMLQKVKDVVTWGEVNEDTFKKLVDQRGREFLARVKDSKGKYSYNGFFELNGKKYHKMFALNPPRKGFGRKGIKTPFTMGGALGYRGEKMDDLIARMI
jgi:large subunit ribosomal protein L30